MLKRILNQLVLPPEITRFEREHLARMNRVALWFFAAHVAAIAGVAALAGTGALKAAALTALALVGPAVAHRALDNPRHVARVMGVTAMVMGALLVHFGQGPMQIEMHFYFFVLLALMAVFADPLVIVIAAATVALHHLALYFLLPRSVFNYDASLWAVAVHALFVVLESTAACFVARSFFDSVIGLERAVAGRTEQLERRTRELRLMLDHAGEGFLTFDRDGAVAPERSAVLDGWLGPCGAAEPVWAYLARGDAGAARSFEAGWAQVVEDVLPLELALDQMPSRMRAGGRELEIAYRPVHAGASLDRMMLVISDVTSEVERERYEEEARDITRVCERILQDRDGFVAFMAESDELVRAVAREGAAPEDRARRVHTLKGNFGLFGLSALARLCHGMEDALADGAEGLPPGDVDALVGRWRALHAKVVQLFGDATHGRISLTEAEYARILRSVVEGASREEILRALEDLRLEPVEARLRRLADQSRALAARLGKGLSVTVDGGGLRLARGAWSPLWAAMVHVVNNAVDHGVEGAEERELAGKAPDGALTLRASADGASVLLEVRDDGRGVDWERVRARAAARGLPAGTHDDLVEALFADGMSTRDEVTQVSGRGVGMGALRAACDELGATLRVESEAGRGTRVEIRAPWSAPRAPSPRSAPPLAA